MTEEERNKEFQQQLENDAKRVVSEFLDKPEYAAVRKEYANHFDEIKAAIDNHSIRTCAEDITNLSPVIKAAIMADSLFFQELHRAIKEGILTKDMLKEEK